MTHVESGSIQPHPPAFIPQHSEKKPGARKSDHGPKVLPHMEHFVGLVRKARRPGLVLELVEAVNDGPLDPSTAVHRHYDGILPAASRNELFVAVAGLRPSVQTALERVAERVNLLCDEFGALAVVDLLVKQDAGDAAILADKTDKFSRALYLFLRQQFPASADSDDGRFDHAEARQEMLRHSKSEKYSSHYLGPKGVEPKLDDLTEAKLRERLAKIFPHVEPDDMIVEGFIHKYVGNDGSPAALFTLNVSFNGKRIYYQQVAGGEVVDIDEPAVTSVQFGWQSAKGALAVCCENKDVRAELAAAFRDVVLGGQADIHSMPMWAFNLQGFTTPAMLDRLKTGLIAGVEGILIQHLVVAKPEIRPFHVRGKLVTRTVVNDLMLRRHRYEDRDIYAVARRHHNIDDLTGYAVREVRLSFGIAKTAHRKAHTVSAKIAAPNGFNDQGKTREDRELIYAQLANLDCARQY